MAGCCELRRSWSAGSVTERYRLAVQLLMALIAGLIDTRVSNDPGGQRGIRHLDRLTHMYLEDVERRSKRS